LDKRHTQGKELYSPHPRLCENSSPLIDFAYKHVRSTVTDCPFAGTITQDLLESGSDSMSGQAFSDMPFTFFVGGEKAGLATRQRKNRSRTSSNIL
ncbi:5745_t:CDS:2, partial [Funneliformis geosporum]